MVRSCTSTRSCPLTQAHRPCTCTRCEAAVFTVSAAARGVTHRSHTCDWAGWCRPHWSPASGRWPRWNMVWWWWWWGRSRSCWRTGVCSAWWTRSRTACSDPWWSHPHTSWNCVPFLGGESTIIIDSLISFVALIFIVYNDGDKSI